VNNDRRKSLREVESLVDSIENEMDELSAMEARDGGVTEADRDVKVTVWQGRCEDAAEILRSVASEEESAAENVRSEDKRDEMRDTVSSLEDAADDLETLGTLEDSASFCQRWKEEVTDLQSAISEARES